MLSPDAEVRIVERTALEIVCLARSHVNVGLAIADCGLRIGDWRLAIGDSQVADPVRSVPPGGSRWAITLPSADCGFPIGFFRYGLIGNRQSPIGNQMA